MISVVVLAKNEEKNIIPCLKTLLWCDEIIVIDDYSTDKTIEKVKSAKLKVKSYKSKLKIFKQHLNNDFAGQRNFGLRQAGESFGAAQDKWVLFVDADERISAALAAEIQYKVSSIKYQGFYLRRRDYFGGKWLRHGETANVKLLRLAKKNAGIWKRQVHEVWEVKGEIGELKHPILHYPHPTVSDFLRQIDSYSTLHAEALLKEKIKPSLWRIIFNPLGKFFQNYFFRLGFLDGEPGLIVALMMSLHSFLAQSKLFLKWKK